MNLWIGFEATYDVTAATGQELLAFEKSANNYLGQISSDFTIHLILVVMSPEIAPPFEESYRYIISKKSYDCRIHIDASTWLSETVKGRFELIARAGDEALSKIGRHQIAEDHRALAKKSISQALEDLLSRDTTSLH